jgi:hypothetical protein
MKEIRIHESGDPEVMPLEEVEWANRADFRA